VGGGRRGHAPPRLEAERVFTLCSGPATWPSSDIEMAMRSFDMVGTSPRSERGERVKRG
jgi:hypothetical protein